MKPRAIHRVWLVASIGLATGLVSPVLARPGSPGRPPDRASAIKQLKEAEYADRMNSRSWTADNPDLDHFYDQKAAEVDGLIRKLESGKDVSTDEIDRALDNGEAQRY